MSLTTVSASHPKAVVVHAGNRDDYQLARAMNEAGLLQALITDVYFPLDKGWFASTVGNLLPPAATTKRFCPQIGSPLVQLPAAAIGINALMYSSRWFELNRFKDRALSRMARHVAQCHGSSLFCYSYYASEAFKAGRHSLKHRFIFQLHPHPKTVRFLLEEEINRVPSARASLMNEHELSLSQKEFERLSAEPHLANGWVAASSYTARTLAEHGIPLERIHVVPYGVDSAKFIEREKPPEHGEPFRIVFVGSMAQRKGLSYLLDAVRMLHSPDVKVSLCGRGMIDRTLLGNYKDLNLELNVGLPIEELIRQLHKADVFVLPSLTEGFAHVVLEAMSCGVPVITTPHTCAGDVMEDGVHGFIVPIRDARAIADKLNWGIENRGELAEIGRAAAAQARLFTWERFREGIRNAYFKMVSSASA
jgi:glycosyltransferase involved in cell wall biosynthesis